MRLEIRPEPVTPATLAGHARTSIAFTVDRILTLGVPDGGWGGIELTETPVPDPYVKEYDTGDEGPEWWPERFDTSNWGMIGAYEDGARTGGAVLAFGTPNLWMLAGRSDLTVLWDLRVTPGRRGTGTGTALFRAAEDWARDRDCAWLKVETQNVNAKACQFYRKMGCTLGGINRFAYPEWPGEVQLLWWKALL